MVPKLRKIAVVPPLIVPLLLLVIAAILPPFIMRPSPPGALMVPLLVSVPSVPPADIDMSFVLLTLPVFVTVKLPEVHPVRPTTGVLMIVSAVAAAGAIAASAAATASVKAFWLDPGFADFFMLDIPRS
ncbi:hypothetical protein GCM10011400_40260 [Paraburkholderia caffeinilytica]|uniref:Tash protein PEST motif family n=1 Tax=Paraburkholderia caffeinilytica TaxID=1761016 RepID=A0ABQ1MXQ5_9BURK|nr:hypothetical protein GCM10011400_40260 [Paraburkholderia caffeinilytica]